MPIHCFKHHTNIIPHSHLKIILNLYIHRQITQMDSTSSSLPKSQINPSKPHKSSLKPFLCIFNVPKPSPVFHSQETASQAIQGLGWRIHCLSIGHINSFRQADKLVIETDQVSGTKTVSLGRCYILFA